MGRRRAAWLLALGLTAGGGLLAHLAAYGLLLSGQEHAAHHHAAQLRLCLAACGTVMLVGLLASQLDRRRCAPTAPIWIFALVPPVGFVVQEQLAWLLHRGAEGPAALRLTAVVLGLVVQIPFAVAAFMAARSLLALAFALSGGLRQTPRLRLLPPRMAFPAVVDRRGPGATRALGLGQCAPPAPA